MADLPQNHAVALTNKVTAALFQVLDLALATVSEAYLPFLTTPAIKQIFEAIINFFGGKLSKIIQEDETLLIISFQSAEKKSTYVRAFAAFQALPEGATQDEIQNALKQARDASDHAIHWPGVV